MNEEDRYIQYLQENLLTEGFEEHFNKLGNLKNLDQLGNVYNRWQNLYPDYMQELERKLQLFTPKTQYDDFFAKQYFEPKLNEVETSLQNLGIHLNGKISVETSTSATPTPHARPTSGHHLLFAGAGTMSFCNYWAKAITAIIFNYNSTHTMKRIEFPEQIVDCFKRNPALILQCSKLCLRYACFGSLLGFGEIIQPEHYLDYRTQLLDAMETFIISHELSHFVAEERFDDDYKGSLSPEHSQQLESFCDELGLQISRECHKTSNWLTYCGVGALTFFSTYALCEDVRKLVAEKFIPTKFNKEITENHPEINSRIAALKHNVISDTVVEERDAVESFFDEYTVILNVVRKETLEIIKLSLM